MRVLIDADAFPNIKEITDLGRKYGVEVIIYIDTNHVIDSDYAYVKYISPGANSVDIAIENEVKKNDLVLTQDYGVATIALCKDAICINQYGNFYTNDNIDYLLEIKNISRVERGKHHIKGPRKRTLTDVENLLKRVEAVLRM